MKEIKELKEKYINGEDDIGRDFIEPCLRKLKRAFQKTKIGTSLSFLFLLNPTTLVFLLNLLTE